MDVRVEAGFKAMLGGKRRILAILAVIAVILVVAWIDGGEEPLRPIVEPVEVPGSENGDGS